VALHPSRPLAFVAHHSTVYVSGDGGESWSALPSKGLERSLLQALVMDPEDPEHLYALAKGRGVFVFTLSDAGESVRTPQ
jgi:photosystem II stability/assembly factor-like uncharacterized protein